MNPISSVHGQHEAGFDVLRTVAAASVILVHVIGPYRGLLGEIPDGQWGGVVFLNGLLRWGVPVFIMITGALMLADNRPFRTGYFLQRRLFKVLIPFLWWSLIYAGIAGLSRDGFDLRLVVERITALPVQESYYHLGFFYYFIPLYLLVPGLRVFVARAPRSAVLGLVGLWLALTALYLAGEEGLWSIDLVMFGGYLLLGFALWRLGSPPLLLVVIAGVAALLLGGSMVLAESFEAGRYTTGRWFSYKSLNTVIAAALIFLMGLRLTRRLSQRQIRAFNFVGRYSLGIYLLHPLFLWPMRAYELHSGHPLIVIPLWAMFAGGLALATSVLLGRHRLTAWMVP